jgi:DNA primase large subunit
MPSNSDIDLKMLYKYPWLPEAHDIFEPPNKSESTGDESAIDQTQYFQTLLGHYFEEYKSLQDVINSIIIYALDKMETGFTPSSDEFNIICFYMLKTILAAYNNRVLDNHIANYLSKIYYKKILSELDKDKARLANLMGVDCEFRPQFKKIDGTQYPFSVAFQSYIPAAVLMKDESWFLINKHLEKGHVYLIPDNLVRLLQEKIRRIVIPQRIGSMEDLREIIDKIPAINAIFKAIDNKIELVRIQERKSGKSGKSEDYDFPLIEEKPAYDLYPPCIKSILDRAQQGENLLHNERLHIAFFFANTNHSVEETVDVFRTCPDFNEEITRYNVDFSRGAGGRGKAYKVFGCQKLKSFQLCKADDKQYGEELCAKGYRKKADNQMHLFESPLEFIFWKGVEINRRKRIAVIKTQSGDNKDGSHK